MNPECPAFLLQVCVRILCQIAVDISAAALCLSDFGVHSDRIGIWGPQGCADF